MPKHSTLEEWLNKSDKNGRRIREWCSPSPGDNNTLLCKICTATISIKGKGFQALTQHSDTEKHKTNAKTKLNPLQLTLAGAPAKAHLATQKQDFSQLETSSSGQSENSRNGDDNNNLVLQLVSRKDAAMAAELQWAMKCVQSSYSSNSCNDIVPLFLSMFGEQSVAKDMSLARTKVTYLITDALGPYFHSDMLEDAHMAVSFSLCFDETVNNKKAKELQLGLRFWSEKCNEVTYHHLETVFIGSATGIVLSDNIKAVLGRAAMALCRFLMISCDGPNVNKTVIRLINETVKEARGKSLLDAGSCNLHILHNSFLAGLQEFGVEVSDFVLSVYEFFDGFPSRVEEYCKSQVLKNVPSHQFLKHVTSRWLTLSGSAERVVEQWPALLHFFLTVIPKSSSNSHRKIRETQRYLLIRSALKDSVFPAKLGFVIQSAKLFEKFSKIFQKSEPMIHLLYEELHSLYILLLGRFCKNELVSTSRRCLKEDFFNDKNNVLPLKDVECGDRVTVLLSSCKEVDVLKFKQDAQKHYQAAATHLLRKSVLGKWPDGKHLKCLQPDAIKDPGSPRSIVLVCNMLRLDLNVDDENLKDEWRLLQLQSLPPYESSMRIDHYWRQIFVIMGPDGRPKFPNIVKVVKAALPIAHGSADIERGFNESKLEMRPEQNRMEERFLNAKLWVRDGLKPYSGRPDLVPMTRKLLNAGHTAYRNYEEHLEAKRQAEAEKARQEAEAEELRRQKEEEEASALADRKTLENLQQRLDEAQKKERAQRQAADQLVAEAAKKLDSAVKKNDLTAVKVAQGMLQGAKSLREEAEGIRKEADPLEKKVEKRRTSLLTKLFKNHKKRRTNEDENPDDPEPLV